MTFLLLVGFMDDLKCPQINVFSFSVPVAGCDILHTNLLNPLSQYTKYKKVLQSEIT